MTPANLQLHPNSTSTPRRRRTNRPLQRWPNHNPVSLSKFDVLPPGFASFEEDLFICGGPGSASVSFTLETLPSRKASVFANLARNSRLFEFFYRLSLEEISPRSGWRCRRCGSSTTFWPVCWCSHFSVCNLRLILWRWQSQAEACWKDYERMLSEWESGRNGRESEMQDAIKDKRLHPTSHHALCCPYLTPRLEHTMRSNTPIAIAPGFPDCPPMAVFQG
jgi:hypothetical protein